MWEIIPLYLGAWAGIPKEPGLPQITLASVGDQLGHNVNTNHARSRPDERAGDNALATAGIKDREAIHAAGKLDEARNHEILDEIGSRGTRLGKGLGIRISKLVISILLKLCGHGALLAYTLWRYGWHAAYDRVTVVATEQMSRRTARASAAPHR